MREVVVETDMIGIMDEERRSDKADRRRRIVINQAEERVLAKCPQVEEIGCVIRIFGEKGRRTPVKST